MAVKYTDFWEDMGFLTKINKDEKENAVNLYNLFLEKVNSDETFFYKLIDSTDIEEWWYSVLPCFTKMDEALVDEYGFDYDIVIDIFFNVVHELLKEVKNLTITEYLELLEDVVFIPLTIFDNVNNLKPYDEICEIATDIIVRECLAFHELNALLKEYK